MTNFNTLGFIFSPKDDFVLFQREIEPSGNDLAPSLALLVSLDELKRFKIALDNVNFPYSLKADREDINNFY